MEKNIKFEICVENIKTNNQNISSFKIIFFLQFGKGCQKQPVYKTAKIVRFLLWFILICFQWFFSFAFCYRTHKFQSKVQAEKKNYKKVTERVAEMGLEDVLVSNYKHIQTLKHMITSGPIKMMSTRANI